MDVNLLNRVQALVGRRLDYQGHSCTVIEILDRENALILRCDDPERTIQGNQFGEATRRVQQCLTLALFDEHDALNPTIERWLD